MKHCQKEIHISPLVSTYCMRPVGHTEDCKPRMQPGDQAHAAEWERKHCEKLQAEAEEKFHD